MKKVIKHVDCDEVPWDQPFVINIFTHLQLLDHRRQLTCISMNQHSFVIVSEVPHIYLLQCNVVPNVDLGRNFVGSQCIT